MKKEHISEKVICLSACLKTVTLALYGAQTDPAPQLAIEDIARVVKWLSEESELLIDALEDLP